MTEAEGTDISGTSEFELRAVTPDDSDHLWTALGYAIAWRGMSPDIEQAWSDPNLKPHVEDWGREGDVGVVAFASRGDYAGAAWVRHFEVGEVYGAVREGVPALAIGIRPEFRGMGLGTQLMGDLMARAKDHGYAEMSLSVERENSVARKLYERAGFEVIDDDPDGALDMIVAL